MNIAYLILLFLAPGLIVKEIEKKERPLWTYGSLAVTTYEQLFSAVVYSIIISFVTITIFTFILTYKGASFPNEMSELLLWLNKMNNLIMYIFVMVIISLIFEKVMYHIVRKNLVNFLNKKYVKRYGVRKDDLVDTTTWEEFFFNKEGNDKGRVVAVFKDDAFVTAGIMEGWNLNKWHEMKLNSTSQVKEAIDSNFLKEIDVENVYYNCTSGLLVKIYKTDVVKEYIEKKR